MSWFTTAVGRIQEKAFGTYLDYLASARSVEHYLASKHIRHSDNCAISRITAAPDTVRVAAVQVDFQLAHHPHHFVRRAFEAVERAVEGGAQIILFPEELGTELLGLLPGVERLLTHGLPDPGAQPPEEDEALSDQAAEDVAKGRRRRRHAQRAADGPNPLDVLRFIGPATWRVYDTTFSMLARGFGVYIAAGSANLPDLAGPGAGAAGAGAGGGTRVGRAQGPEPVCNRAYFYDPDGRLLGTHEKIHLIPTEARLGLSRGASLPVFETPWAKMAMPVCMDATYFETFRVASLLGCEVVLLPVADTQEYNFWKALRGIWPRVQESGVYGVMSPMVGRFLGMPATQRASVFAPVDLTAAGDGVVAMAAHPTGSDLVLADLDLAALREYRRKSGPERGLNLDLLRRELPDVYIKAEERWGRRRRVLEPEEG